MKNKLRKTVFSILLVAFSFFALLPPINGPVHAQEWYNPSFGQYIAKVMDPSDDEIFGERYTHAQVIWIVFSLISMIFPAWILECIPDAYDANFVDFAVMGGCIATYVGDAGPQNQMYADSDNETTISSVASAVFINNPMSGTGYLYKKAQKIDLVQEVHAQQQGFGYDALQPVQTLWTGVRNITYFLLVFAAIIMAFMIMFRTKTSPQTVITVQSAIPKLVIALLLVTFSYAIAGLIIDLAYVSVGLLAIAITDVSGGGISNYTSPVELFPVLLQGVSAMGSLFLVLLIMSLGIVLAIGLGVAGASAIFTGGLGAVVGLFQGTLVLTIIFLAVVGILILILWLRAIWTMVRAFISIVVLTIVSPIMILMGVFPGYGGFGAWIRAYAAQVAVFPTVILMVFLAHYFFWAMFNVDLPVIGPLLGAIVNLDAANPFQIDPSGGVSGGGIALPGFDIGTILLNFLGAIGFLFLIPHAAGMIRSLIEREPFPFGAAFGRPLGAPGGALRAATWDSMMGREVREQSAALSAYGMARRVQRAYPERAPGRKFVGDLTKRLKTRAGH